MMRNGVWRRGTHLCEPKDGNELLEHFGLLEQHRGSKLKKVIDAALSHDPHQLHGNLGIAGGDQWAKWGAVCGQGPSKRRGGE